MPSEYWEAGAEQGHFAGGAAGAHYANSAADGADHGYANGTEHAHAEGYSAYDYGYDGAYGADGAAAYGAEAGYGASGAYAGEAAYSGATGYQELYGSGAYADAGQHGGFGDGSAGPAGGQQGDEAAARGPHVVVAHEGPNVVLVRTKGKRRCARVLFSPVEPPACCAINLSPCDCQPHQI